MNPIEIILSIFKMFSSKKEDKPAEKLDNSPKEAEIMALITLENYFTSFGRYKDRAKSKERTKEVEDNAKELLERVNALLDHLEIKKIDISSGFRPSEVNATIANAAKKSAHTTGEALDLVDDKDQSLCKKITKDLLNQFDLYREDSDYTKGWCHLQTRKTGSGKRIFKP